MNEVFSDDTLEHRCEDGHYWREHTNGQVTPSWGYGGTFIDIADPSVCPQPTTDERGHAAHSPRTPGRPNPRRARHPRPGDDGPTLTGAVANQPAHASLAGTPRPGQHPHLPSRTAAQHPPRAVQQKRKEP
jgi:hypothetical protein